MKLVNLLFSRRWLVSTILVIAAAAVMVRLGFWQLDRLAQRRVFNAHILAMQAMSPLDFNTPGLFSEKELQPADLVEMEYRETLVSGEYDFTGEVALANQAWNGRPGYSLLTPLRIEGTQNVVIVQRGWVPLDSYVPGESQPYQQPGIVHVRGMIRVSSSPSFGMNADLSRNPTITDLSRENSSVIPQKTLVWNNIDLPALSQQYSSGTEMPIQVMPVYIQRAPEPDFPTDRMEWPREKLPFPEMVKVEITEGSHLGYALQWFAFATILVVGYPYYLGQSEKSRVKVVVE